MDWRYNEVLDLWELVLGGRVVDRLTYDDFVGEYRNSRGDHVGPRWDDAKATCQKRAAEKLGIR